MRGPWIAAAIAATLLAGPAAAQYGGIAGGGYGGFGDRPDYGGPPPARRYAPPPEAPGGRYGRSGGVCVTPNGECFAGGASPGSACGCTIPGFGRRRGAVE